LNAGDDLLKPFVFPEAWTNLLYPNNGVGQHVLQRNKIVTETIEAMMTKARDEYPSHYWRGPAGSGKTTCMFLYFVGKSLLTRGCKVYYLSNAEDLNRIDRNNLTTLTESGKER
jgi:hypothetical protein